MRRKIEKEGFAVFFEQVFWEIKGLPEEEGYLFSAVMLYILKTVEGIDMKKVMDYAERIIPERRGDIMTIAEKLIKEGMKEGMREGIAKAAKALNALKKGHSVEEVAKLTGLAVEQVEEIKKSLEE
ncbi:hypothetical protein [Thermosyntropha sp.]|uniref:hypothetical protein n=1 Tax=Thermosyntropha sp. TaxID=2740820 RepID=UPI0025DAC81A|nr:hypothetical protein [Thermosyntropha sp.]MBO8159071.1 hypothetical protein [Thermosyntropha sp.]